MSPHDSRILLVEDDERIRIELLDALRAAGYDPQVAVNLRGAQALAAGPCDLVLLDLGLPDGDGLDLCRELRRQGRGVPIIILTARDSPDQRVRGLDVGADDYVVKPFHMPELLARIRSVLRRSGKSAGPGVVRMGDLWVDPESRTAGRGNEPVSLKRREWELLLFLVRHPGRPWTREQLLDRVWGSEYEGESRTIDVHVRRLRAKIEDDPGRPQRLVTEWGVGYRMQEPPTPETE